MADIKHAPPGCTQKDLAISLSLHLNRRMASTRVSVSISRDGEELKEYPLVWTALDCGADIYAVTLPACETGLYWYRFFVDGRTFGSGPDGDSCIEDSFDSFQLSVYEQAYVAPAFLHGGVMYQVMVDRFYFDKRLRPKKNCVYREDWDGVPTYKPDCHGIVKNDDFFGGNLNGIRAKLDYLASLHVTCIYFNPIFEAASNHKYDTADYFSVDKLFGTNQDLRDLVEEARERGMSVVLDGVFNHTGCDSIYFNSYGTYDSVGAYQSKASTYADWYRFSKFPSDYDCWWGIKLLPAINECSPTFREFVSGRDGVIRYWLRQGVAGWRLDVADELPDFFLAEVAAAAKAEKEDALVLGEVWEDASNKISYSERRKYFLGRELDSVTNYPFRNAILDYCLGGTAVNLDACIRRIQNHYPKRVLDVLMNVLGTHDTARILTTLSGVNVYGMTKEERSVAVLDKEKFKTAKRRLALAAVLQYTLPGYPCVFYGDEAGMQGHEDPFNRRCYPWGKEDRDILNFYKRLGQIRLHCGELSEGDFHTLVAKEGIFVYMRTDKKNALIVGVNNGEADYFVAADAPCRDLWNGSFETNCLCVPAGGFAIYRSGADA